MINKICKLQDEVNSQTSGKDWRKKELLWTFAIQQECSELVESLNLKWWKGTTLDIKTSTYSEVIETTGMDYDNCVVEAVDLLHFLISYMQVQYTDEEIVDIFDRDIERIDNKYNLTTGSAEMKLDVFKKARNFDKGQTSKRLVDPSK